MTWFRRGVSQDDESPDLEDEAGSIPPPRSERDEWYLSLKRSLHLDTIAAIGLEKMDRLSQDELQIEARQKAQELCLRNADLLTPEEQHALVEEVLDETFGFGPIESLMQDHEISDILINGPRQIYIEKHGQLELSDVAFHDEDHLLQVIQRIVANAGRRIDEKSPIADARLPDGSRLNAIIKPLALNGPVVSIRRFGKRPLTVDDLLKHDSVTPEMLEFLSACVHARINILISGGAGSGKTTLLNCLSKYIPRKERVATIEDAAELMLQQPHVVIMETRPPNLEGEGEVTMRELVKNTLRMRPDRIIVGECRGDEALDMLQAMNTGHEGSMTTVHANSPRDAVTRLEMMIGMSGFDLPVWVIRKQIASSIDLVIQVSRMLGGKRKIVKISEITGMEQENVMMHDIFEFVQTGIDETHSAVGYYQATGMRPEFLPKLNACGINLDADLFHPRKLESHNNNKKVTSR